MKITTRERRDWTLLIFIVPIGIIFMMIAGQIAVWIVPEWSVNAGMQSQLDPATAPKQDGNLIQPVLPEILTPLAWFDTFLTPGSDSGDEVVFPPFIVLEPSATPSPTSSPTASPTVTETPTASPSPTVVTTVPPVTSTTKPPDDDDDDKTPTPAPVKTCKDPAATNFNGPLPCTYPPPPVISTIDPGLVQDPPPAELGTGAPNGDIASITPGRYVVVSLGSSPVVVNGTSDTNYDLVYYESNVGGNIMLDRVIIGISQLIDGSSYYEVFNWGNNTPDTNTNVDTNDLPADPACTADPPECDNRNIPNSELHPDPSGTGVLIDVDNAPSAPPAGNYEYIVIISPLSGAPDGAQVDTVEVVDVTPTP